MIQAFKGFPKTFWFSNIMEFVERWAYYGVRLILSVYIVTAASQGGLEFTHIQKGQIYAAWAVIQSTLPILVGSYPDKFGFRRTLGFAIVIKVIGYLLMATQTSYIGFFTGCMLLASGTAIFKPSVQGMLVASLNKKNSSVGWGLFYWLINVGAFLGPWLAGYLRILDWQYVFYGNAIIVSFNLIILLFCPKIKKHLTNEETFNKKVKSNKEKVNAWFLPFMAIKNLFLQPSLLYFLLIYSGFWLMYNQIFDLLPNFIDDWIDSSGTVIWFGKAVGNSEIIQAGINGAQIPPEWLISLNCLTIVLFMIPLSFALGKIKIMPCMTWGILITLAGMLVFGLTSSVVFCITGIVLFSIGEMACSPKMREYLGLLAPKGEEGQFMGYANLPEAIGWGIGSLVAGHWYENFSDKHNLAKHYLIEKLNLSDSYVEALSKENILPTLMEKLAVTPTELNNLLWNYGHPERIWYWFIAIGLITVIGLIMQPRFFPSTQVENS